MNFLVNPIARSGTVEPCGSSMPNFWRNCQSVFKKCLNHLYSHWQCTSVPISLYPRQHLLLPVFLIAVILLDVNCYLVVLLICISLIANDGVHLFMCFLAIHLPSLKKCLLRSFAHFVIGLSFN